MEQDLEKTIAVVLIIGLTFLIMATYAFLNTSYSDSIPKVTASSSNSFLANYNSNSTLTNTPSAVSSVTAKNQTWLSFDGVNDWVNTSKLENLGSSIANNFTISFWLNSTNYNTPSATPALYGIKSGSSIIKGYTNMNGSEKFSNGSLYFQMRDTAGKRLYFGTDSSVNPNVTNGTWRFVTAIYAPTSKNGSIYVDAIEYPVLNVTTSGGPTVFSDFNRELIIGSTYSDTGGVQEYYEGWIDNFRVYNRSLTQAEITALYFAGRKFNTTAVNDGLVFYAPFNEGSGTTIHSYNQSDFA